MIIGWCIDTKEFMAAIKIILVAMNFIYLCFMSVIIAFYMNKGIWKIKILGGVINEN